MTTEPRTVSGSDLWGNPSLRAATSPTEACPRAAQVPRHLRGDILNK